MIRDAGTSEVEVSVVVPCHEERDAIADLIHEIRGVLSPTGRTFEILVVDDGSCDGTLAVLQRLTSSVPELRPIEHAGNFGQSAAVATGFREARGETVVTMDGDGQNNPADVPALLEALATADIVCGVRSRRRDTFVRRASSRVANAFRRIFTGDSFQDAGCGLRAIRREALAEVPVFNGMHRFLPTIVRLQGFAISEVPVGHRPRMTGRSKYGIGNRLFRGILDCFAMLWWRRRVLPARRSRS